MSKMSGRHGMTTREERRAASSAAVSRRAGVSITTMSTPSVAAVSSARPSRAGWASSTTGVEASRRSLHLQAVACGSMSSTTDVRPACSAATASVSASVVLPVPPFWATRAITSTMPNIPHGAMWPRLGVATRTLCGMAKRLPVAGREVGAVAPKWPAGDAPDQILSQRRCGARAQERRPCGERFCAGLYVVGIARRARWRAGRLAAVWVDRIVRKPHRGHPLW